MSSSRRPGQFLKHECESGFGAVIRKMGVIGRCGRTVVISVHLLNLRTWLSGRILSASTPRSFFSICPFRGLAKLRVLGFSSWQLSRGQNEHATEVRFSGPEPLRTSMGENPLLSTRNVCLQTPAGTSCCLSVLLPSGHARSTCHFVSGSCSLRIPVVS